MINLIIILIAFLKILEKIRKHTKNASINILHQDPIYQHLTSLDPFLPILERGVPILGRPKDSIPHTNTPNHETLVPLSSFQYFVGYNVVDLLKKIDFQHPLLFTLE
jgi:hypothetical protein